MTGRRATPSFSEMTAEQREKMRQLREATSAGFLDARYHLVDKNWNVQEAINQYNDLIKHHVRFWQERSKT